MSIASEITRLQNAKASIKTSIENKGVVVPSATKLDGYSTLIDQISQGTSEAPFNDVNFYDYDGTRLYSYTKAEFANLTELPANPTHDGLTSQGWNWTLSDAKTYVANYGILDIGQLYITNDNKTRLYVSLQDGALKPYISLAVNGTATIEWGDGTSDTITGTSTTTNIHTQHTYASAGDYVVKISSENTIHLATDGMDARNTGSHLFWANSSTNEANRVYGNAVKKIELGSNITIDDGGFAQLIGMETITIPSSLEINKSTAFGGNLMLKFLVIAKLTAGSATFQQCYALKGIAFNKNANIGANLFSNCYNLTRVVTPSVTSVNGTYGSCSNLRETTIPNTITTIQNFLGNCYSITKVKLPSSLTTINAYAFSNCYSCKEYDFTSLSAVPTLANVNAFNNIQSDCKIVVPDSLYNSWIGTTNWSNYASYIIKESDYNA